MKNKSAESAAEFAWQGERRLFLGILPDSHNARQLSSLLPQIPPPAKPVAVENLHLTLLFLGQSTARQAQQLCEALSQLPLPAFSVMLDQWQLWPGPAVLCLAGEVADPALSELYQQLLHCAAVSGFAPPQHRLKPHITLARRSKTLPAMPSMQLQLAGSTLVLFHSASTGQGVSYRPLWQLALTPN
jgi:RNA 2',3'-cyclic 3'-phosphodiesterase